MATTSSKPSLSLSLSPAYSRPRRSSSPPSPTSTDRRVTSWGSGVSETGSFLSLGVYGDRDMTPLPSPVSRAWDSYTMSGSGQGRSRGNSVFEELAGRHHDRDGRGSDSAGSRSGGLSDDGRSPPERKSKTMSFFDLDGGGVLSPPPNPLSRNSSLSYSVRSQSVSEEAAPQSWLDRADSRRPSGLPRRQTDSPDHSPDLSPLSQALPSLPIVSPLPPSFVTCFDAPSTSRKPVLPALQTTLRESAPAASPSPLTAPHRAMSALPSAIEPPAPRGGRFLNFGPRRPPPVASVLPAVEPLTPPMDEVMARGEKEGEVPEPVTGENIGAYEVVKVLGKGAFSRVALAKGKGREDELVALKLIARSSYAGNERMRISVVREVEVLKHIHHLSLVALSASLSTPLYTVLVLEYAPGGELFDFIADWHSSITEGLARRMFGELCGAVGWMHEIGLVHRDIKLENILLTSRPFPSADPSNVLSTLPTPFVKLTDFGLSRFILPSSPLLATRCGSEAYAAPELIMGKKYDGRRTDAWALGVVLFALTTGGMPFVEEGARKAYLLKIAKGEYKWPSSPSLEEEEEEAGEQTPKSRMGGEPARLVTPALKSLVGRLLVRDPEKRARVDEVWETEWMQGEGRAERVDGWVSPKEDGEGAVEGTWERRAEGD